MNSDFVVNILLIRTLNWSGQDHSLLTSRLLHDWYRSREDSHPTVIRGREAADLLRPLPIMYARAEISEMPRVSVPGGSGRGP